MVKFVSTTDESFQAILFHINTIVTEICSSPTQRENTQRLSKETGNSSTGISDTNASETESEGVECECLQALEE
jgi:hypothetical protein